MLKGVRIIQIEGLGPGPFAAMTLADLGAEVTVVHRKDNSGASPGVSQDSILDRGKRSIELDLKDADDIALLKRMIRNADGLIEGFRPGVMERLGIGPDDCLAINPKLIYGRMTGWGQDGPLAMAAGHDLNYIGVSGALWYASLPDQPPIAPPTLVGDIGGGALYLVIGMLSAIINARSTGKGTVVDAAIVDGSAHMMNLLMSVGSSKILSHKRGNSLLDGPHFSRSYRTSDGGFVSVQCLEPKFYQLFLDKLGLGDDPEYTRQFDKALWPTLCQRTADIFAAKPLSEWAALFEGSDACVASVLSPLASSQHPHMMARGVWLTSDGVLQAAAAPRFGAGQPPSPGPVPRRGQHSAEIRSENEG
ncbi:MAG: CaiB/BaiF CoA-transferase family protein [Mesorhizobium sp.]